MGTRGRTSILDIVVLGRRAGNRIPSLPSGSCSGCTDDGNASIYSSYSRSVWLHRCSRGLTEQICLSGSTGQCLVRLLVILNVELKSSLAGFLVDDLVHWVYNSLDDVISAPDCSSQIPSLLSHRDRSDCVFTRALDRRHIKPKDIASFCSASNVEGCMALQTRGTSSLATLT